MRQQLLINRFHRRIDGKARVRQRLFQLDLVGIARRGHIRPIRRAAEQRHRALFQGKHAVFILHDDRAFRAFAHRKRLCRIHHLVSRLIRGRIFYVVRIGDETLRPERGVDIAPPCVRDSVAERGQRQ